MSRNKVSKQTQLKSTYTAGGDGESIGIYTFQTAEGKSILVPARDQRSLSKKEKTQLRHIQETLSRITVGDLLLLFENKEEGLKLLEQDELPLLDVHNRINATEDMKYFNMLGNKATEVFYKDILEGAVYLTSVIGKYQGEDMPEPVLATIFLDQGSNKMFTYVEDPECPALAMPVEAAQIPTAELMCYIMDDIYFRVQLLKNPENESTGAIEKAEDYLVPMEYTVQSLVENGLLDLPKEV